MSFPWGQPSFPVTFTCPYCKDVKSVMHENQVLACDCPGAQEDRVLERQRTLSHSQTMEEAYQARMAESRRKQREKRRG